MRTMAVILEYCGGENTDHLVRQLRDVNPDFSLLVLDNASPARRCNSITHRNQINTDTGGGIRDCVRLATSQGASFLIFIANDVQCITPISFKSLENAILQDSRVVQASATLTVHSAQAKCFPWMITRRATGERAVLHADFLLCILDLAFITSFGGFPESRGGWGYDWEFAYQAHIQSRVILALDELVINHGGAPQRSGSSVSIRAAKAAEARRVYDAKYGFLPRHELLKLHGLLSKDDIESRH